MSPGMNCAHCGEPLLPGEMFPVEKLAGMQNFHRECAIRMIIGSAAHQLGECRCFGGRREDPPGMTTRQAALLAYETFEHLRDQQEKTPC